MSNFDFPPKEPPKEPEKVDRRETLKRLAIIAGGLLLQKGDQEKQSEDIIEPGSEGEEEIANHLETSSYPLRELSGQKLEEPSKKYLGLTGETAPETLDINFLERLRDLWQAQKSDNPAEADTIREMRAVLIEEYQTVDAAHATLSDYAGIISSQLKRLKEKGVIDWTTLGEFENLTEKEIDLVRRSVEKTSAKEMLALILNELMPKQKGKLNVQLLDFLVRNAGISFINRIPSQKFLLAIGPYALNKQAVDGKSDKPQGASRINRVIKNEKLKIKDDVLDLRGNEFHRATFMRSIANLIDIVKSLDETETEKFSRGISDKKDEDLSNMIAISHRDPGMAQRATKAWLADDMKKPWSQYLDHPGAVEFIQEYKDNLEALIELETNDVGLLPPDPRKVRPAPAKETPREDDDEVDGYYTLPPELKGTRVSKGRENRKAAEHNLSSLELDQNVRDMRSKGYLVDIPRRGRHYHVQQIGVGYKPRDGGSKDFLYTARPWVKRFIEQESSDFAGAFPGSRWTVTSLARSREYLRWLMRRNKNASPTSVHLTGSTFDMAKSTMTQKQIRWMRRHLVELERQGLILATEEFRQRTFHVFVLPTYK